MSQLSVCGEQCTKGGESLCCCAGSTGVFQGYVGKAGMGDRRPCNSPHKFVLKEVISNLNVAGRFTLPGGHCFMEYMGPQWVRRGPPHSTR